MDVDIITIRCRGAYKAQSVYEAIIFETLIESLNTGIAVHCIYQPRNAGEWHAEFVGHLKLYEIEQPNLDWKSFTSSGISLCDAYLKNPNLDAWWASYCVAASRKRLELLVGVKEEEVGAKRFAEIARAWIKAQGFEVWSELPSSLTTLSSTDYIPTARLYKVCAKQLITQNGECWLDIFIGIYEAHDGHQAIEMCWKRDKRTRSKYLYWNYMEISIGDVDTVYINLAGNTVYMVNA